MEQVEGKLARRWKTHVGHLFLTSIYRLSQVGYVCRSNVRVVRSLTHSLLRRMCVQRNLMDA